MQHNITGRRILQYQGMQIAEVVATVVNSPRHHQNIVGEYPILMFGPAHQKFNWTLKETVNMHNFFKSKNETYVRIVTQLSYNWSVLCCAASKNYCIKWEKMMPFSLGRKTFEEFTAMERSVRTYNSHGCKLSFISSIKLCW
jgi:hypothetical protein